MMNSTYGEIGNQVMTRANQEPPKTASQPPVDRAMEELHKHVAILRDSVQTLVGRLEPVSNSVPQKENCGITALAACIVEGQIKGATADLSEITRMVDEARESLCI